MVAFKTCVVILVVTLSLSNVINGQLDWRQWLTQQRQRQQQEQQEPEQPPPEQEQQQQPGVLRRTIEERRRQEELAAMRAEREEAQTEEMQDLMENYELEELALQLGRDTLGRILRPLREQPTTSPLDDCVSREWPVEFEFGVAGNIKYDVCGSGDQSSLRMRFVVPGLTTTPSLDTTTPIETTTVTETTTTRPPIVCPTLPASPAKSDSAGKPADTAGKHDTPGEPQKVATTPKPEQESTTTEAEETTVNDDETTTAELTP